MAVALQCQTVKWLKSNPTNKDHNRLIRSDSTQRLNFARTFVHLNHFEYHCVSDFVKCVRELNDAFRADTHTQQLKHTACIDRLLSVARCLVPLQILCGISLRANILLRFYCAQQTTVLLLRYILTYIIRLIERKYVEIDGDSCVVNFLYDGDLSSWSISKQRMAMPNTHTQRLCLTQKNKDYRKFLETLHQNEYLFRFFHHVQNVFSSFC